jgi:hypothetical protein
VTGPALTWPLTNSADEGFQPNSVTSNALTLHNNASAVNGITITGSATTAAPSLAVTGSDTNIGLNLASKGNAAVQITTTRSWSFSTYDGGSGTDSCLVMPTGGSTSGLVSAEQIRLISGTAGGGGSGSVVLARSGATQAASVTLMTVTSDGAGGSTSNGVTVTAATTGSAPSIAASGTDTNINLTVAGKGTGVVNYGYAGVALGGGAAPTVGTIGGSGPASAAQVAWLKIQVNGTASYVPYWQ